MPVVVCVRVTSLVCVLCVAVGVCAALRVRGVIVVLLVVCMFVVGMAHVFVCVEGGGAAWCEASVVCVCVCMYVCMYMCVRVYVCM